MDIRFLTNINKDTLLLYYDAYLYNLKQFAKKYSCYWISPNDIKLKIEINENRWIACNDPFLKETAKTPLELGRSILEKGTFWHISTIIDENNCFELRDGVHRIWSLQQLIKIGECPKEKTFFTTTRELKEGVSEDEEIELYYPILVDKEYKIQYDYIYNKIIAQNENFIYNNRLIKVVSPVKIAYLASVMYAALLRDAFFYFKDIKPSPIINNEKLWNEWMNKNNTNLY